MRLAWIIFWVILLIANLFYAVHGYILNMIGAAIAAFFLVMHWVESRV